MARKMSIGLQVVPVKHTFMEWGYVIVDQTGRVVARGNCGPSGGPLIRKGAAKAAGAQRLSAIMKNQKRIDKALKKSR